MAAAIPRFQARDASEKIHASLASFGAVIVEDMLSPEVVARFNGEVDAHLNAADPNRPLVNALVTAFFGPHTRHITGMAAKSRTFVEEVLCHPVLLAACDEILLPACVRYQLNIAHLLDRGPGSEMQYLHRDELVWCQVPKPHPELQVASIFALEDFTAENGATRIAPGSHRWEQTREAQLDELVAAEMPAGSAVLYLGSTIHGGGPNTTADQHRRGMHLSYTLGWLRTEENQYLSAPPDVVRGYSQQAQELLGYATHDALALGGGYLGAVDTRNPIELLKTGEL